MISPQKATENFVREKIREAKSCMKSGQELEPKCYFVVYYPAEDHYSYMPLSHVANFFDENVNRRSLIPHIKKHWQIVQLVSITQRYPVRLIAVVLINDSFLIQRAAEVLDSSEKLPLPSAQPDRREAIMCTVDMNKEKFGWWYIYDRIDNRIVFEPERAGGELGDDKRFNFTNLWPEGA